MALKWDKCFVIPRILFNKASTGLCYKVRGSRALRRVEISLYKIWLINKNWYFWILYYSAFETLHFNFFQLSRRQLGINSKLYWYYSGSVLLALNYDIISKNNKVPYNNEGSRRRERGVRHLSGEPSKA